MGTSRLFSWSGRVSVPEAEVGQAMDCVETAIQVAGVRDISRNERTIRAECGIRQWVEQSNPLFGMDWVEIECLQKGGSVHLSYKVSFAKVILAGTVVAGLFCLWVAIRQAEGGIFVGVVWLALLGATVVPAILGLRKFLRDAVKHTLPEAPTPVRWDRSIEDGFFRVIWGLCLMGLVIALCGEATFFGGYIAGRSGSVLYFAFAPLLWGVIMITSVSFKPRSLAALLLVVVVAWGTALTLEHTPYFYGLKQRLTAQISPDQLRAVASQALKLQERDGMRVFLCGPGKPWVRDSRDLAQWKEISVLPGLKNLDDSFALISEEDSVDILWGGALMGHWGVRIRQPEVVRRSSDVEFVLLAPDIAFVKTQY